MVPTANPSSSKRQTTPRALARQGQDRPRYPATLRSIVEWLADLGTTEHWVVSCYLKLEPRDRSRGKYLIKLKNRIRERLAWLEATGVPKAEREIVERDLDRLREYLEHPDNLPEGRGIAVFACEPLGLFEAVPLPRVFRSRLAIDRSPLIRELAALDDEFGLVLCSVCDRASARFFAVSSSGVEELMAVTAEDTTRPGRFHGPRGAAGPSMGKGSAGEHNYHRRIEEEKQRHYADVATRLFDAARGRGIRGVVLAGTGTDAAAVEPHLHPYLGQLVMGTARLNPKTATAAEVMDAVLEVRRRHERVGEADHVAEVREKTATGWAVNGIPTTLAALSHGQVRSLLVDPSAVEPGYRCRRSGRLLTEPNGCADEGGAEAVPDVVDEAIEETLRQGGHVDVIEDEDARTAIEGLAAVLRFKRR